MYSSMLLNSVLILMTICGISANIRRIISRAMPTKATVTESFFLVCSFLTFANTVLCKKVMKGSMT